MSEILVIGHKNPDADAVCSAYSYAYLKNAIDRDNLYTAARCGVLNKQTKFIFDKFNIEPPIYIDNVYLRVKDIMTKDVFYIRENDPFWLVLKSINSMKIRLIPVVDSDSVLLGVISIPEIAAFFAELDTDSKPKYLIRPDNFPKVIPGYFIKSAEKEEFVSYFLVGAMPFGAFKEKLDSFNASEVVLIVGNREEIVEYAKEKGVAAIILTGISSNDSFDFDDYEGWVYVSTKDTAETLRLLALSTPSKYIMDKSPIAKEDDYISDIGGILKNDYHRGMPVVDKDNKLKGILTRSDFLKKKKKSVILVDHNEYAQAVDGIEEAEIKEIIDHHRLGSVRTDLPIYVYAKPAGSSCTLVYQLYKFNKIDIPKDVASIMLSGILSDTVVLKSPTTTQEDIVASEELSKISNVDINELGEEIFSVTESLINRDIDEIVDSDFKIYKEFGVYVGIGQVEVTNLNEVDKVEDRLVEALNNKRKSKGLDWIMLMVTDIINRNSVLISLGAKRYNEGLHFSKISENKFYLPDIISRKKQLLPEVLRILEDVQ